MRLNYISVLFAFYIIPILSISQTNQVSIKIELGELFKNDQREIPVDIIGGDEYGYYILYNKGRFGQGTSSIRKFNKNFIPSGEEIQLTPDNSIRRPNTLGVGKIKENIVHIWSETHPDAKRYFYQFVNLDGFTLGEKKQIIQFENVGRKTNKIYAQFIISDDDERILMYYVVPNEKRENQKFRVHTFDSSFGQTSYHEYEFPYENRDFGINSLDMDNNGDLILLASINDNRNVPKEKRDKGFNFLIYKLLDGSLKKIRTIDTGNIFLRSLDLSFNESNDLLLTGIFSRNNPYAMSGIYFSKIDGTSHELLLEKRHELDEEFATLLLSDGRKKERVARKFKEGKYENPNYIHRYTLQDKSGDFLIMTEQVHSYSYNGAITYYHQNIGLFKLDSRGKLIWSNKIGKENRKGNVSIYSSFYPVLRDSELILFYNCSQRNLGHRKGTVSPSFGEDNIFVANQIGTDSGEYKRRRLTDKRGLEGITIRPLLYNWIDDKTLVMFGQDIDNLKNQRFMKVFFD